MSGETFCHRDFFAPGFSDFDGAKKSFVGGAIVRREEAGTVEDDACLFCRRASKVAMSSSEMRHRSRLADARATLTAGMVPSLHQPITVPFVTPKSLAT